MSNDIEDDYGNMEILQNEECDICDKVGKVICFDFDMSESQICEECICDIYRHTQFGDGECFLKKR